MFVVRPVHVADIPALEALVGTATPGVHTLPRTRESIAQAVERSVVSFASRPERPGEETYFFVLESVEDRSLAGTATIASTAGSHGTFFAFRNDVIQQVSRDLGISHSVHALSLSSDLSGYSQLSGFYLRNQHRAGSEAQLLSRARLLFAALAPQRFSDRFFAAMAGITDANACSPFWDALGRKFFQMAFLEAERLIEGARNRTLIAEMMPHYPVYVPLLPHAAQAAMGRVHVEGALPLGILTDEGFEPGRYIDLFDGGVILQARRNALRSFCQALPRRVGSHPVHAEDGPKVACLIAAAREPDFRAIVVECAPPDLSGSVALAAEAMRRLDVVHGDAVLCVRL
jgi:arginine N-succinyltransferase